MPIKIPTVQTGLEESIRKAIKNVNTRGGLNIAINDKNFTRPLGKITGSVSEFNKSLEASNARVIAFGASVGIIQGVQKAFASLVQTTIEVERKMTEINVVMGLTNKQLDEFSSNLFKVAKNTAQSFNTVATAATELARQGLTMEETLKRTNDALILTRLTGLDAAAAVNGLTAALNTFNKAGLDSTKILSKMAAVDVQFAVSTEDLIDAVSRAGAVAQDAGVSFDELLGAVTAAQQTTARGGKVIGNSFKTIFTRVQRSSTLNRLEELGIAVRDVEGNTLPAIRVLENLSSTYERLADTTKAAVAEQVGGVFQINILKAAIKDLSSQNSILARATKIASTATDEAYKKNEILNRSLSALTAQTATSIQELSEVIGNLAFSDSIRDYLTFIRDQISGISDFLGKEEGESMGSDLAQGLVRGFGKVLSGPGLVVAFAVLSKLFLKTVKFLGGSVKELLGVVSAAEKQRQIQKSIVAVLGENSAIQKRILSQEGNRAAQERTILSILQAQSREQAKIAAAAAAVSPGLARAGFGANLRKTKSEGHVPNYVSNKEKEAEKKGALEGGYKPGAVKSMNMPGEGRVVYNTAETVKKFVGSSQPAIMPPQKSDAGKKYKKDFAKAHGFDPYMHQGSIPNYALKINAGKIASANKNPNAAKLASTVNEQRSFDGKIGLSALDNILTSGLFKSIDYTTKKGQMMTYQKARWGVNKYKKGAPAPGNYVSYGEMDKATGTRALWVGSEGEGADAYRRLILSNVSSVVSQGKKYKVDPSIAAQGHIPNFAGFQVKKQTFGGDQGEFGPPKQVQFSSFVGDKQFVQSQAVEIDDPMKPGKKALQVVFTGEADKTLRGKGYGRKLYEYMASFARKRGYSGLYGDMSTSLSAMRVIDSIAKQGSFNVLKNKNSKFSKDTLEPEGMWGADDWTYKLSNRGYVPNFALPQTPYGQDYIDQLYSSKNTPQIMSLGRREKLEGSVESGLNAKTKRGIGTEEAMAANSKYIKSVDRLIEYEGRPSQAINALKFLDNKGLTAVKNAILQDPGIAADFDYYSSKGSSGKINVRKGLPNAAANIAHDLRSATPREFFAYLTGKTDRIQGTVPGQFIQFRDAAGTKGGEKTGILNTFFKDIISDNELVTSEIKKQFTAVKKSKNRQSIVGSEVTTDLEKKYSNIGEKPKETMARLAYEQNRSSKSILRSMHGGQFAQQWKTSRERMGLTGPGYFGEFSGRFRGQDLTNRIAFDQRMADQTSTNQKSMIPSVGRSFLNYDVRQLSKMARTNIMPKNIFAEFESLLDPAREGGAMSPKNALSSIASGQSKYMTEVFGKNKIVEDVLEERKARYKRMFGTALGRRRGVPNFAFGRMKTLSQAVKSFKQDGGMFHSRAGGKNFWSTKENSIKLSERNYEDIRQFLNSKSFRGLSESAQAEIKKDLRAQSEALGKPDVTRPYMQFSNPEYAGRIMANRGKIPNFAKLFSDKAESVLQDKPEFSGAVSEAIEREKSMGFTPKVVSAPQLKSGKNPGLAVVNQEQEGGSLEKARKLHGGKLNPNQKTGEVPNFAKQVSGGELLDFIQTAKNEVRKEGLNQIQRSFMESTRAIDKFTASTEEGRKFLDQYSKSYAGSARSIKEFNIRESMRLGTLGGESLDRQNFARQAIRADGAAALAGQGGPIGELVKNLQSSQDGFEKTLVQQMSVARASGDTETLKVLKDLDRQLDQKFMADRNMPAATAKAVRSSIRSENLTNKRIEKFSSQDGFNKKSMERFYGQEFLKKQNVKFQDKQEANAIMAALMKSKEGRGSFQGFLRDQGVASSNKYLARAGLMTGDFGRMTEGSKGGGVFLRGLEKMTKKFESNQGKSASTAFASLMKQATKIGSSPANVAALQGVVQATREQAKATSQQTAQTARVAAAQSKIAGGSVVGGSFSSGLAGSNVRGAGFRAAAANSAGRMFGGIRQGAKGFMKSGMTGFGGNVGLGLSFILPMLSGMIQNPRSREDRAVMKNGQFQVQDRGRDTASNVLMGAGMGAIFGPTGALVGAAAGFIQSMKKQTLSIEEQVRLKEKEISLIGQNISALSGLQNLQNARAEAFSGGNQMDLNRLDAQINQTLASINDKQILKQTVNAMGDQNAMSKVEQQLADRMAIATSQQNFAMGIRNNDASASGVALGSMMMQRVQSGETTMDKVEDALTGIKATVAQMKTKSDFMDIGELNALRKKANRAQGFTSGGTMIGGGVGAAIGGIGAKVGMGMMATGVGAIPGAMIMGLSTAVGGIIGTTLGREIETMMASDQLKDATTMGVDELKELQKLATTGVMDQNVVDAMIAAFREGEISMLDIANEATESLKMFKEMTTNAETMASQIFNLNKTFKDAITKLTVDLEVKKIAQQSELNYERSVADYTAQFMGGRKSSDYMADKKETLFEKEAGFRRINFQQESDISLIQGIKANEKNLNFNATEREQIIKGIQDKGMSFAETIVNDLEIGGRELQEEEVKVIKDLIIQRQTQGKILEAQILAERKSLQLSLRQNAITEKINQELQVNNLKLNNAALDRGVAMTRASGDKDVTTSRLQFKSNEIFRGYKNDEQEASRQQKLRKDQFDEELKFRQAEVIENVREEALRLASERDLINSLNNLGEVIEKTLGSGKETSSEVSRETAPRVPAASPVGRQNPGSAVTLNSPELDAKRTLLSKHIVEQKTEEKALKNSENNVSLQVERLNKLRKHRGSLDYTRAKKVTSDMAEEEQKRFEKINAELSGLSGLGPVANPSVTERKHLKFNRDVNTAKKGGHKIMQYTSGSNRGTKFYEITRESKQTQENMKAGLDERIRQQEALVAKAKSANDAQKAKLAQVTKEKENIRKEMQILTNQKRTTSSGEEPGKGPSITQQDQAKSKLDPNKDVKTTEFTKQSGDVSLAIANARSVDEIMNFYSEALEKAKGNDELFAEIAEQRKISLEKYILGQNAITENMQKKFQELEAQARVTDFTKTLKFTDLSQESASRQANMDRYDVRAAAASSALQIATDDRQADIQSQMLDMNPFATRLERAEAKLQSEQVQYKGDPGMMDNYSKNLELMSQLKSDLHDEESAKTRDVEEIKRLQTELAKLNETNQNLILQMERTTPRDKGFAKEFTQQFSLGLEVGFAGVEQQAEGIYARLGQDMPMVLKDGLADAMQTAISGAESFSDAMKGVGIQLLNMVQQAFLQSAASRITGAIGNITGGLFGTGGEKKFNVGGVVTGGSGVRDDVPAMLTGGEYVIKKSSVDKYGVNFMNRVNSGMVQGFNEGGGVNLNIAGPKAAKRESYQDKNDYGSVTRYKETRPEIGISRSLSAKAISNDRQIQEFFREQENQFQQDLETRRQEEYREKVKKYKKKQERNVWKRLALTALGGFAISKGMDWLNGTGFMSKLNDKNQAKALNRQLDSNQSYTFDRGRTGYQIDPIERKGIRSDIMAFKKEGWTAAQQSKYLRQQNIQHKITGSQDDYRINFNTGGNVPSILTGGEYVMSKEAVQSYGTGAMDKINSGTFSPTAQANSNTGASTVSHGDVNISINVNDSGSKTENSSNNPLATPEFASRVKNAVMEVIAREKRIGGTLR
jgi:TP901 family phage tail tape measure protein